ncbi:helix-turn-helix transcriptional regulator [Curtobacterium pusillum]|uniref:ArsR/SmtB family transcription factor n=1 Tax=Curtobacterium pusillum TaxID=69373 RepID=UPI0011AA8B6B|nr:metalloregulator ArsR/SmtB family transcription factor [Curtobacterium pusillum]
MVARIELSDAEVDRVFHALADATRRDIVRRTLVGEASVSELADAYAMSFAAVQKHVAVLEGAGLVTKRPRGRTRIVRAEPGQIDRVRGLLDAYADLWRGRIDRLDALLGAEPELAAEPDFAAEPDQDREQGSH